MSEIRKLNYLGFLGFLCIFGTSNQGLESHTNVYHASKGQGVMAIGDVKEVMEAHAAELMAIPGVVGVYIGVLDDKTPCIKVMVKKRTPELDQKIPHN